MGRATSDTVRRGRVIAGRAGVFALFGLLVAAGCTPAASSESGTNHGDGAASDLLARMEAAREVVPFR